MKLNDNEFYKSIDGGKTWELVSALPAGALGGTEAFFIDSQGNFFVALKNILAKSTDKGQTWSVSFNFTAQGFPDGTTIMPQGMTEDQQGNLYFGVYGDSSSAKIYKSSDRGSTWTLFKDWGERHIHACQWNPYKNALYVAIGDDNNPENVGIWKYNSTWTKISPKGTWKTVALLHTENYTYVGVIPLHTKHGLPEQVTTKIGSKYFLRLMVQRESDGYLK